MKKNLLRFIAFIIIFALVFAYLQPIFNRKHNGGVMVAQFYNEPKHSLDVIMVGASGMRSSLLAPVIWDEAGITSYNLAMSGASSAAQYYLLKEVLRFHSPSVVLIQANFAFSGSGMGSDIQLRNALDYIPLSLAKLKLIADIATRGDRQGMIDFVFPLLYYHDRDDISKLDFDRSFRQQRNLYMGSWRDHETTYHEQSLPGAWAEDEVETRGDFLLKMLELCRERDIAVVIVNTPSCREARWNTARHEALVQFAAAHELALIDFIAPDMYLWDGIGLDVTRDFFDSNHTNVSGGGKVSRHVARFLAQTFDLPDRRMDNYDSHWDDVLTFYDGRLNRLLSSFPESDTEPASEGERDFDFDIEGLDQDDD